MYERFTDRARKVMQLAIQEAMRFNHEYIGTEHILLGLVKEGDGVAANVLKNLDIDLRKARWQVELSNQIAVSPIVIGKVSARRNFPAGAEESGVVTVCQRDGSDRGEPGSAN